MPVKLGGTATQTDAMLMKSLAEGLDEILNGKRRGKDKINGFVLLTFPFGAAASARCNYVSNGADRKEIVILMKEMIARFEGQPEVKGHG